MVNLQRVSPAEAKQLIDEEGYVYLDVRSEPEYASGHPAGALNIPVMHAAPGGMRPNTDFLDLVVALYPKDAKLVVGCRSGQRSLRAAEMLVSAGYQNIVEQRAGSDGLRDAFGAMTEPGWGPAGLPMERETPGASYPELRDKAWRR
jgi:rhodanese-related sulfurtransferase